MDTIVLRGGPRERGLQQGWALRTQIQALGDQYRNGLYSTLAEHDVRFVMGNMLRFLEQRFPEILEELAGVAEAAGLDFEAVARMNFGTAIANTVHSRGDRVARCSAVAFADTPDGPVIGKNCDLRDGPAYYALKVVIPDDGIPYLGWGEVGGPWVEAAINARGLAIGQASAPSQPNQDGFGMPALHSLHLAMQHTARVEQTVQYLEPIVHAGQGANLMCADADGTVVALERGHDRQVVRPPERGYAFFTNHFLSPEMQAVAPMRDGQEHSERRAARYRTLLASGQVEHTIEGIKRAIGDHGRPAGPCQHGEFGLFTRYACLLIPRRREMRLYRGPACSTAAESYYI